MLNILVTIPVTPAHKERFESIAPGCRFTYTDMSLSLRRTSFSAV